MAPGSEAGGGGVSDDGAPGRTPGGSHGSDGVGDFGVGGLVGDGRYRLTHRLGRGGMAEVFAAEDVRLGRTVAVKLLRPDLAEDPVSKARFTREAQSVAGLNHHAIVAVYDSGEDVVGGQSVPYIVMELVEGRTIRDLLMSAEAPPPEQALIIVSGVLEALAYSHQHGIVHRDIKPANVIITNSGAVKVMDFGIARALHGASTTMTQTGMVMGTPQYLSPEQALGKAVDRRSDLYATGCLLYELLALRPPFVGETPLSVVYQHVQDIPVPPSEVGDGAPPELDGLAMRALAKDPDDRFQSADEMRGMVQYALRMLQEQGGHTGLWNTGPVGGAYDAGHTPDGGMGATAVMTSPMGPGQGAPMGGAPMGPGGGLAAHQGHPGPVQGAGRDTSQGPILPPMNPDDGAYTGGYPAKRGGGRGKVMLFVAFALVAIMAGVVYAINASEKSQGEQRTPATSPSPSVSSEKESTSPSPSQSEQDEDEPDTTTGGGDPGWNQVPQRPTRPTYSQDPGTASPNTSAGTDTTTGGTEGTTTEGGTTDGGTEGTTDGGTEGTSDGSNGDGGTTGDTTTGTTSSGTTGSTTGGSGTTGSTDGGSGSTTDGGTTSTTGGQTGGSGNIGTTSGG